MIILAINKHVINKVTVLLHLESIKYKKIEI